MAKSVGIISSSVAVALLVASPGHAVAKAKRLRWTRRGLCAKPRSTGLFRGTSRATAIRRGRLHVETRLSHLSKQEE
jgi:hypothetical protein